jgi:hypothetical protein
MRAMIFAGLVVLSGCDWDVAETRAFCTRSGTCDGGVVDSGATDSDSGVTDAGATDASVPDAGALDAGEPDAGGLDAGTPDAGRADGGRSDLALTTNAGTAFGVTFDGQNVWSVVTGSAAGTTVFREALSVYSSGMAPAAMYANEETDSGVLLGLSTQLVMFDRDGGFISIPAAPAPRLVSLFVAGTPFASMWSDSSSTYNQQVFTVPSLAASGSLTPLNCATLTLHDVEVLPTSAGGGAVLTYQASGCPSNGVTMGVLASPPPGVQLITPTGTRSGFSVAMHSGRTMVGRTSAGFDLASLSGFTITVTHHTALGASMGSTDTISATDALELGDTMFGYVLVVAQGMVERNTAQIGTYGVRTALLVPLDSRQPVIVLGAAGPTGRLGLWAGPALVAALWDDSSGHVMLTRITR